MFTLKKFNVVKVVDTESKRDRLLAQGFIEVKEENKLKKIEEAQTKVEEINEEVKEEKPKSGRKATK